MIDRRTLLAAALASPALPVLAQTNGVLPNGWGLKQDDTLAPGVTREVLVRWGDRVTYDAPPFDPNAPTPESAGSQFGWDGRICGVIPSPPAADGIPRAVLAVAHPTVDPALAWPGGAARPAVAAQMQGATLLNLQRQGARWIIVDGGFQSRRLTADTLCRITGPAVPRTGGSIQGLVGITGGCATPWGSLLLTEGDPTDWLTRLRGLDGRFAEANRFGWVAELDPQDPASVPVKRTALGRFNHGDAAAALSADGRAVVFMTDRRAGGGLFRFVSAGPAGPDALDEGTLSVATASGGGIAWADLPSGADAVLNAAQSAVATNAAAFDAPSGLAIRGTRLVVACRGSGGSAGEVIEVTSGGDWAGRDMARRRLVAGAWPAPTPPPARNAPPPPPPGPPLLAAPDVVGFGPRGSLWVGTDRRGTGEQPDALFGIGPDGAARAVYAVPRGASVGGVAVSAEGATLLTIARTPGNEPGATWANPTTRWPALDPNLPPRTTLVGLARQGGW
ncbi:PhoX family protein [Humitalea sp. 24SJ18S-53]|uniref:PhoX family protein n=1 Tax=Humitalea sp. 24SJ18S-53 TaxID=3422307 RepID=UPI003D67547B